MKLIRILKKVIKFCLPYGVIRFLQVYRSITIKNLFTTKDVLLDITQKNDKTRNNKKVVLYDATILSNGYLHHPSRTGIYTVAYNILLQMVLSNKYKIKLYSDKLEILEKFLKQEPLLKNVSVIKFSMIDKIHYIFLLMIKKINEQYYKKYMIKFISKWLDCIDIYFSPYRDIPNIIEKKSIKKYRFLYDTIPLLFPNYFDDAVLLSWIKFIRSLNNRYYYFSDSESAKRDFLHFFPALTQEQIQVIPLGTSSNFYPCPEKREEVLKKYNIESSMQYIFTLCTLEPRKNLVRIIRTFLQFIKKHNIENFVILMGGTHWKKFFEQFQEEIQGLEKEKIILLGYVADEDLAPLYSGAEFFVYTSQYEGFGLPPLEAMKCGCPVITSNNSSLPEVVGDAGIMIDYDSDEQHIQAYEKYYFDKEYANEMREKGLKRAEQFTWEKCFDIIDKTFTEHCK